MSQGDELQSNSKVHFNVKILSPEKVVYRGAVTALTLPGVVGEMMILPGHAAMVSALDKGAVTIATVEAAGQEPLLISSGYVEVSPDGVTVLASFIDKATNINASGK